MSHFMWVILYSSLNFFKTWKFRNSGHPQWDPKRPTDTKQKMEREGRWKGDDWRPEGWQERLEWGTDQAADDKPKEKVIYG